VTLIDSDPQRLATVGAGFATSTSLGAASTSEWIVEATGSQSALSELLRTAPTGSSVLLLGFPYGREPFSFESVVAFDRTVIGSVGSSSRDFREALALLPLLDLDAFLGVSVPLAEYERAWERVRSKQHLKVMLRVDVSAGAA
jgi:threonine dehydrogenase-like Zn-dependent dehydrogenase